MTRLLQGLVGNRTLVVAAAVGLYTGVGFSQSLLTPQPVTVVDDRGVSIRLAQPPVRIVSLLPSLSETVCALHRCEHLVATDRYSNWPTSLAKLPKVGGGLDPNIEAIVALRPDVVFAASSAKAATRLESLGIPVIALEPKNLKDMQRVLSTVGQILGLPAKETDAVWLTMMSSIKKTAQSIPPSQRPTRVYFEVNQGPYGASESSFIGQLLQQIGVKNIVPGHLGPFPKLNPEFIVRANPDLIMVGADDSQELSTRPGWRAISAVRENRICKFNTAEGDVLVRAGPRMAQAAELMARCVLANAPHQRTNLSN